MSATGTCGVMSRCVCVGGSVTVRDCCVRVGEAGTLRLKGLGRLREGCAWRVSRGRMASAAAVGIMLAFCALMWDGKWKVAHCLPLDGICSRRVP